MSLSDVTSMIDADQRKPGIFGMPGFFAFRREGDCRVNRLTASRRRSCQVSPAARH